MLNVKVKKFYPVVSEKATRLKAMVDVEIGDGLIVYGLKYKLNQHNEYYVEMPEYIGRDGEYHAIVEPLSKEFAARIKAEVEKANIEGENYIPTCENGEIATYNFNLKSTPNGNCYGNMRVGTDFIVKNITIRDRLDPETGKNVKFVSLPSRQDENGNWWSVVRPANDTVKNAINKYGVTAIGKIAEEYIGNTTYKEMKDNNADLSFYRYQNVNYAKKIGEELSKKGIRWSGKVEKAGAVITISADEADTYSEIVNNMRENNKAHTEQQTQTAEKGVNESDFFAMDEPDPF